MCLKKARRVVRQTFVLLGYDNGVDTAKLFAGWLTVKKFKAKHLAQAKVMGRGVAKKLGWRRWRVRKEKP